MTIEDLDKLKKENEYLLIDFFATWCMPCKLQSEVIRELQAKNVGGLHIVKIDVDENEDVAIDYGISTIPTLIMYKGGEELTRNVGLTKLETITSWLEKK